MAILNYSALVNNKTSFTPGQDTKILVSTAFGRGDVAPTQSITLSALVAVNDTSLAVTATPVDLYEGTRLAFVDAGVTKPVYVAAFTAAGAASVPILAAPTGIATASVATLGSWIPLFSANQVNQDQKADVIKELNFSAGFFYQKAVTGLDATATAQGTQVYGDPGLAILSVANLAGQLVHVTVLKGSQRGGSEFDAIIGGLPESVQRNQFFQQTINFEPTGAVVKFNA